MKGKVEGSFWEDVRKVCESNLNQMLLNYNLSIIKHEENKKSIYCFAIKHKTIRKI